MFVCLSLVNLSLLARTKIDVADGKFGNWNRVSFWNIKMNIDQVWKLQIWFRWISFCEFEIAKKPSDTQTAPIHDYRSFSTHVWLIFNQQIQISEHDFWFLWFFFYSGNRWTISEVVLLYLESTLAISISKKICTAKFFR